MLEHEVEDGRTMREKEPGSLVIAEPPSQPQTAELWTLFTWKKNNGLFY